MSLTLTLNACFQGCARIGPPGLRLGTRQQACSLCLEGPVRAGRLPALTPSSSCSDDPSSACPAGGGVQAGGRSCRELGVDAHCGRCRMWAPGLGVAAVSGSARRLYRGLVVQKGNQTGSCRGASRESVYPSHWARTPVSCSHAVCWCVFNFLVDLFLFLGKQNRSLTFDPQWGVRLGASVSLSPRAEAQPWQVRRQVPSALREAVTRWGPGCGSCPVVRPESPLRAGTGVTFFSQGGGVSLPLGPICPPPASC